MIQMKIIKNKIHKNENNLIFILNACMNLTSKNKILDTLSWFAYTFQNVQLRVSDISSHSYTYLMRGIT